jgi:membrane fusion protein, multidrug efflux system
MLDKISIHKLRSKKGMRNAFLIVIAFLIILFGGLFGLHAFIKYKFSNIMTEWKRPPVVITASSAISSQWNPYIDATGTAKAIQSINVSAQTSGIISKIYFKSGDAVKKGQHLFDIDSSVLQAQLKQDQAQEALKKITYLRDEELFKTKAVSQQTRDTSKAEYLASKAATEATRANIQHTIITAPFSGTIGIRKISIGDFFKQGDTAASLDTMNPIFIDFTIPGNDISKISINQKAEFYSKAFPQNKVTGIVSAINSRISNNTKSIEVRALVKNNKNIVFPGMFVTVHLLLPAEKNITSVPQTAINYTLYGDTVYKLTPKLNNNGTQETASYNVAPGKILHTKEKVYIANSTPITIGVFNGKRASITSGISSGDLVVTSGQLKLKDGDKVTINNKYTPKVK